MADNGDKFISVDLTRFGILALPKPDPADAVAWEMALAACDQTLRTGTSEPMLLAARLIEGGQEDVARRLLRAAVAKVCRKHPASRSLVGVTSQGEVWWCMQCQMERRGA